MPSLEPITVTERTSAERTPGPQPDALADVLRRLETIQATLQTLLQQTPKEWYSTAEVAERLKRAEFTVREWARLGRIRAEKRRCGRGSSREWTISHGELTRIQNHGLLPFQRPVQADD